MSAPQYVRISLITLCLLVPLHAEDEAAGPLKYERLELTDGRNLLQVTVKSYDAKAEKLLLVTKGKAMILPIGLVAEPLRTKLKEDAPAAGGSLSTTPAGKAAAPNGAPAPGNPRPAPPPVVSPEQLQLHQEAALRRAQNYYRYEYPLGSGASRVTAINFETDEPEAVTGWVGRYRTQGRVFLEFFDSKGWSYSRTTSKFEVITVKDSDSSPRVLDFSVKS